MPIPIKDLEGKRVWISFWPNGPYWSTQTFEVVLEIFAGVDALGEHTVWPFCGTGPVCSVRSLVVAGDPNNALRNDRSLRKGPANNHIGREDPDVYELVEVEFICLDEEYMLIAELLEDLRRRFRPGV